jgi:predicted transposase YbfD/YdcC
MLAAWCAENGDLVVGPIKTDSTSNEITAVPALLPFLAIKGCRGTMEARGCQTARAHQMQDQGEDYRLALKGPYPRKCACCTAHCTQSSMSRALASHEPETAKTLMRSRPALLAKRALQSTLRCDHPAWMLLPISPHTVRGTVGRLGPYAWYAATWRGQAVPCQVGWVVSWSVRSGHDRLVLGRVSPGQPTRQARYIPGEAWS